jgi:hypothetical protein
MADATFTRIAEQHAFGFVSAAASTFPVRLWLEEEHEEDSTTPAIGNQSR